MYTNKYSHAYKYVHTYIYSANAAILTPTEQHEMLKYSRVRAVATLI